MIEQYNSLAEKFIRKGFWLYIFWFIIWPIWYIIKIIISWELSVSDVWVLYGIISLVTLISAYNDLWMTESLKHFLPKYVTEKDYTKAKSIIFYALFAQVISSLIIASIFWFWSDFLANNYFKSEAASDVLKVFAFFFIWINIFQTLNNFFIAVQDTFSHKITELIRMMFILIFVVSIFFLDLSSLLNFSFSWLVWLYVWILVTIYVFYKKYYKKYFKNTKIVIDKKEIKTVSKYAFMVFIWAWAATILWQIDMQMIIYMLGTTDAWYYTNYLSIIWIPFIIIAPIFAFLFPVFSEFHSKWDHSKIKIVKDIFTKNFILIAIMFNIFFFVYSNTLTYTLFGEKFITSWEILKYSILLLVFNFLLQINFNIMAGIWKVKQRVQIVFIAIVFNFIMNLILINTIWVYWAALATWLWWILIWLLSEIYLWKQYFINFDYISIIKNTVILWVLWTLIYKYIIPYFWELSRLESLFFLAISFFIWTWVFVVSNLKDFKFFILEIKKLKKTR